MPNITVVRSQLFEAIGKSYTDAEFDELCFEFGVEVDDVEPQVIEFTVDGETIKEEHVVYVIAIPANRYDLLCLEGFARALRIFIGKEAFPVRFLVISPCSAMSHASRLTLCFPHFTHTQPITPQSFKRVEPATGGRLRMTVEASTSPLRPFVVCAVLRGVKFDNKRYKSFIDLQEKLHQNICRKRTYVAIGTHDLDTLQPPFRYCALPPEQINFVPLTEDNGKSFGGKELMDHYREDPLCKHLKPYTDIIYSSPVYPVIYDSANTVLSLPPIINGKHSCIRRSTTNVFIECTGTDLTKCNIVLDTMVTMFSEYCSQPFTAEAVEVHYAESGKVDVTPLLSHRTCDAKVKDINGTIGINITADEICNLCNRMQLGPAEYLPDGDMVRVHVPPTRSDVLHPVDVIEDVAIAYGYNNIKLAIPSTLTVGAPLPINQFTDLLRAEIARAGYVEMLTHGLCSTAENFTHLRRPLGPAVSLSNPANVEYEVVRTTLLPGALKTLAFNKSISHREGIKLFEISDVVLVTDNDIGSRNARRMTALFSSHSSALEVIHGLVDRVMTCAQIQPEAGYAANSLTAGEIKDLERVARQGLVYFVKPSADPAFFPGMAADIVLRTTEGVETVVGVMGVVHPEVLSNYDISYPCSVVELDIEAIM